MTARTAEDRQTLRRIEDALELPMIVLGLAWLALAAAELVAVLPTWLEHVATAIWAIFVGDFLLRLVLAPDRVAFLRHNLLVIVALVLPALRVFRIARAVRILRAGRAVRGVRLARMATTFGRARRSIHELLARRHALGYVVALTVAVAVLGAAGMLAFEPGFDGYGDALWWTAMVLTTMGSESWPRTFEGRVLCLALAVYGFAVFGYVTATIASWLVGRDRLAAPHSEGTTRAPR